MKITDVKAVYPNYRHVVPSWRTHLWQIVVRIDTDIGVTGYGYGGGGVAAVEVVNAHFRELLLGRTVDSVEDIAAAWDFLYAASLPYGRKGIAIMGLSGVDLALWDLLGHAENKPVYDLLGGRKKQQVPVYATGGTLNGTGKQGSSITSFLTGGRGVIPTTTPPWRRQPRHGSCSARTP